MENENKGLKLRLEYLENESYALKRSLKILEEERIVEKIKNRNR